MKLQILPGFLPVLLQVCFCILPTGAFSKDITSTSPISVRLTVPWPDLATDEFYRLQVDIENLGTEPLPIAGDPSDIGGYQLFVQIEGGNPEVTPPKVDDAAWPPVPRLGLSDMQQIEPGETRTLFLDPIAIEQFPIAHEAPESLWVSLMVGEGQWVVSNKEEIRFHEVDHDSGGTVFEGDYVSRGADGEVIYTSTLTVFETMVAGERVLFSHGGFRICTIPEGVVPKFELDPETWLLEVDLGIGHPILPFSLKTCSVVEPSADRASAEAPRNGELRAAARDSSESGSTGANSRSWIWLAALFTFAALGIGWSFRRARK